MNESVVQTIPKAHLAFMTVVKPKADNAVTLCASRNEKKMCKDDELCTQWLKKEEGRSKSYGTLMKKCGLAALVVFFCFKINTCAGLFKIYKRC